jgi:hypothetical protein
MGKELVAAKEKFKEEQIQRDLALRKKEKQVRTSPSACDLCASPWQLSVGLFGRTLTELYPLACAGRSESAA